MQLVSTLVTVVTNTNSVQSPQMSGHPKKGFQSQTLTPLMETSESRTSTISRPAPPPAVSHCQNSCVHENRNLSGLGVVFIAILGNIALHNVNNVLTGCSNTVVKLILKLQKIDCTLDVEIVAMKPTIMHCFYS